MGFLELVNYGLHAIIRRAECKFDHIFPFDGCLATILAPDNGSASDIGPSICRLE